MRYPAAQWKPLPQNARQPAIVPTQVILHSLTSPDINSSWGYFAGPNAAGTEAHFLVGYDGHVIQAMDTQVRADAQWAGNAHAISIETASNAGATDPWTSAQLAAITALCRWIVAAHPGVGHRICRSWDDPGFGYHRLFDEWNVNHHSCPGNSRIAEFPTLVRSILTPPDTKDLLMTLTAQEQADFNAALVAALANPAVARAFAIALWGYRNPVLTQKDAYAHLLTAGPLPGDLKP